jgi:hypothetical protein
VGPYSLNPYIGVIPVKTGIQRNVILNPHAALRVNSVKNFVVERGNIPSLPGVLRFIPESPSSNHSGESRNPGPAASVSLNVINSSTSPASGGGIPSLYLNLFPPPDTIPFLFSPDSSILLTINSHFKTNYHKV